MSDRPSSHFWRSVVVRLLLVWLLGWAAVAWFHGCLAPSVRDEVRDEQRKALPPR